MAGAVVFALGFSICVSHDSILIAQRRPGEDKLVVPQGALFNFVAQPNYLGEIIEWGGFAIMTQSLAAAAFVLWSCANLVPTALNVDRWYRREFGEKYPRQRRAIVPFIL
eukprot:TRINITY_DN5758_c0_g1_i1.p4 TRINITY_DN5758_c0_g1~~TRINITY_DN5758_c0_g1_i1.p4  ORF type:complete len:110 (+),score=36.34 TRINITY_DN5758_c0_g1_i1:539-868(+)